MAKLPDMTTTERPSQQPSMGVVSYRANAGEGLIEMGVDMQRMAEKMRVEQDKLDTIAAEDALTKLREKQLDLTNGPENGFANVKGEGAIKPDFYSGYRDRFDQAAREIDTTLTDSQRQKFRQRANVARLQFNEGVLRHAANQGDVYAEQTYKGIVAVEEKAAEQYWNNPNSINMSITRIEHANNTMAERFGWSADVKEANYKNAIGKVHAAVIERAMVSGAYDFAKDWYETYKKDLDPSVYEKIKKEQDAATFDTRMMESADEVLAQAGNYDEALKLARKLPDGKMAKEVASELNRRQTDELQALNRMRDESLGQGHLMIEQGVSRAALKQSSVYRKLDAGSQAKLLDSWDAQQRERRSDAEGRAAQPTKEQWERYADLVALARDNPEQFRKLDIKAELWNVPKGQRDNLMTMWQKDPKEDATKSTITYSQQMTTATRGIDKDKRGMFEAAVQQEVMALEASTKKKATSTETQQIIDRMLIQGEVLSGHAWMNDPNKTYYELTPSEKAKFAPAMSDADRQAIVDKFKQKGNANPSDEEIMGIYKKWKGIE